MTAAITGAFAVLMAALALGGAVCTLIDWLKKPRKEKPFKYTQSQWVVDDRDRTQVFKRIYSPR